MSEMCDNSIKPQEDKSFKMLCIIKELLLEIFVLMLFGVLIAGLMKTQLNILDVYVYFIIGSIYTVTCSIYMSGRVEIVKKLIEKDGC